MADRFRDMQVFAQCAESGSFSAAAKVLGTTSQNVAKIIKQLEASLGCRLINRNTRNQSLTEIGNYYYGQCRTILNALSKTENTVSTLARHPAGTLRVVVPSTFGIFALAERLPEWFRGHPSVSLDLVVSDTMLDIVREGWDLALFMGEPPVSDLVCRRIHDFEICLAAAPSYLKSAPELKKPLDLKNHVCIRRQDQQTWDFCLPDGILEIPISNRYVSNNCQVSMQMAVQGMGVTKQPLFRMRPYLESGALARVLADSSLPRKPLVALYPSRRQLSAKVGEFLDFLVDNWRDSPD